VPSQQEVRWSQLKVGVLVLVALAALTALVFLMSGDTGGFFSGKLTIISYFENSAGLKVGAPVTLEGVTIGNVKAIHIVTTRQLTPVEVVMNVSKKYAASLHKDTKASLDTVGVLGDTVVDLDSKHATGAELKSGDELGTNETPNLSDVIKSSQGTIQQLDTILAKMDNLVDSLNTGKGSIAQIINSPDLYNKAIATVNQLNALTEQISNGKGTIGKLLNDDTLYNNLNDGVVKIDHITSEIDSGKGNIGKLLKDDTLYNNLNSTVTQANQLITQVNAGQGALGVMAKDPQFAQKLKDTVDRLDSILNRVDNGEGTLGQLVRNPSLYNNTDQMLTETRGLVTAIREDPKKYLTFHVKVF
jgi:phospholipid/cholesterol/gamma-HCH transport system substrate-binding protein